MEKTLNTKILSQVDCVLNDYESLTDTAIRIVKVAREYGITLRLMGGLAVAIHCHGLHAQHLRAYHDVDFFGLSKESKTIRLVLEKFGYSPDIMLNAIRGTTRMKFDKVSETVEVFLDKFIMEHVLDFRTRVHLDSLTIPLTDLFLTKIQNVKLAKKDLTDIVALLADHDIGRGEAKELLEIDYIAKLCSDDWGLWKSVTDNLSKVAREIEEDVLIVEKPDILNKITRIREAIDSAEKTFRWKLRAHVGEKVQWYYTVEE